MANSQAWIHGKTQPWRFVVVGKGSIPKILDFRDTFCKELFKNDEEKLSRHLKKISSKKKTWGKKRSH